MAPSHSRNIVGRYVVYQARFVTQRGTVRIYIGHSACMDIRRVYHKSKPPAWLQCRNKRHEPDYKILEAAIPNRETATALEALHAARAIAAEPKIARGGPWAKPTLEPGWRREIDAASNVRSLMRLQELGWAMRTGRGHCTAIWQTLISPLLAMRPKAPHFLVAQWCDVSTARLRARTATSSDAISDAGG